jgi:hypothetical protein
MGNELVDGEARYASLNGSIFGRPLSPCDFQSFARPVLLREWQRKWDLADTGPLHSAESIITSMVRGSEGREELCYLCI